MDRPAQRRAPASTWRRRSPVCSMWRAAERSVRPWFTATSAPSSNCSACGCSESLSTKVEDRQATVAVVVVNWNDAESSIRCLVSVHAAACDVDLVLVDNGSVEDPRAAVRERLEEASVVRLETNLGYAGGCNAGADFALARGADYVFFLNNDTRIDKDTIPALLRAAQRHPDAILGPKIVYAENPDVVWSAGGFLVGALLRNHHLGQGEPASACQTDRRVAWTTGCAFLVSAACYRRVGPMDERYFLYLEDTDWCIRAARRGVETWFVPEAEVRHEVSRTLRSPKLATHVRYYSHRNQYRLALRYSSPLAKPLVVLDALLTLLKAAIRSLLSSDKRKDSYYHARTRAVLDFLRGRYAPMPTPPGGRPEV